MFSGSRHRTFLALCFGGREVYKHFRNTCGAEQGTARSSLLVLTVAITHMVQGSAVLCQHLQSRRVLAASEQLGIGVI